MASLSEQVAQETWEMMFRMLGIGTGLVGDTIAAGGEVAELSKKGLEALIDYIRKKNAENQQAPINEDGTVALQELVKKIDKENAKLLSMPVADEDVSLLKEHFKKQGLTFAVMDVGFDDVQLFLFVDKESRKAEKAVMQAQAERGLITDINPDIYFNSVASENIGTITGLSNLELELFRFHAKRNGLMFTSVAENGTNTVVYNLETAAKAKQTAADVLWSTVGTGGELVRTQIEKKISMRQAVNRAFLDDTREHYIVSGTRPENYIHITADEFEYYKNSQKVFAISRSNPGFMDRAIQAVNAYELPTLLDKETFERSSPEQLKERIKGSKQKDIDNEALKKTIEKQIAKRVLIEEKMELDDEHQNNFWLFDDSISYSEASTSETINDLEDDQREMINEARHAAEHFGFTEIKADDKNLDYLIAKAEAQRNRGYRYAEEPAQDRENDL